MVKKEHYLMPNSKQRKVMGRKRERRKGRDIGGGERERERDRRKGNCIIYSQIDRGIDVKRKRETGKIKRERERS